MCLLIVSKALFLSGKETIDEGENDNEEILNEFREFKESRKLGR